MVRGLHGTKVRKFSQSPNNSTTNLEDFRKFNGERQQEYFNRNSGGGWTPAALFDTVLGGGVDLERDSLRKDDKGLHPL
jgi:hypothetical protein